MGAKRPREVVALPKYLWKASYTISGAKGVAKDGGSSRRDAVRKAAESVGGTLDAFYFAFGGVDVFVIADLPDDESAVAVALAVNSSGGAKVETVPLLTPEQLDAAAGKSVDFTPAGG
jgi:uncharacterized protein with GYD domain